MVAHLGVPADIARLFRAMLEHSIASWRLPTPRAHRVFERDGGRCTVPGCTSQPNLHAHHVLFRSAGAATTARTSRRSARRTINVAFTQA
jgi:hypothetical protein